MKNKKLTYGLLIVVAVLWGLVFYRIFESVFTDDKDSGGITGIVPKKKVATDPIPPNFTLMLDYRDPFLGNFKTTTETLKESVSKKQGPPMVELVDWSFIHYLGVIINPGTGKKVSLLNINGQDHMMEEGTSVEGVKLIRNYTDSIKISFNGIQTNIKK